jgi:hypothetical protein
MNHVFKNLVPFYRFLVQSILFKDFTEPRASSLYRGRKAYHNDRHNGPNKLYFKDRLFGVVYISGKDSLVDLGDLFFYWLCDRKTYI